MPLDQTLMPRELKRADHLTHPAGRNINLHDRTLMIGVDHGAAAGRDGHMLDGQPLAKPESQNATGTDPVNGFHMAAERF
ncbi:MAG: hypothetical protein GQ535_03890 [Rhodobacteraceae bacterium]|nr:hypothetical protein [Paracoccaceae bacterium]